MSDGKNIKVVDRRTFGPEPAESDPPEQDLREPEPSDKPSYVELLEERTARAEAQLARTIEAARAEADENLSRIQHRLQREASRDLARLRGELVGELLEVLDNFDRSLAALPPDADTSMRQGLRLVRDQFFGTLARFGLSLVDAEGLDFDPQVHEAVSTTPVEDPERDGTVVAVLKPGYRLGDQLIRPALVQVARHAS